MAVKKYFILIIFILLCEAAGIIGAFFTVPAISTWYASLIKPSFTPPNFVFAPVWTLLYLLMGISLYFIWQTKDNDQKKLSLKIFFAQLGLNILWSIVFFGGHSLIGGLLIIVVLWILILLTIFNFLKVNKLAGLCSILTLFGYP